jgi:hypothetical protein
MGHHNGTLGAVRVASVALVVAAIALLAAAGLALVVWDDVAERSAANAAFAEAIQEERARATRENCRKQNRRNHKAVARVGERTRMLPPVEQREGREGRAYTIALIDALAPVRDCEQLVERTVVQGEPD